MGQFTILISDGENPKVIGQCIVDLDPGSTVQDMELAFEKKEGFRADGFRIIYRLPTHDRGKIIFERKDFLRS